jgi:LPXTG-motif cell wall-anchored protein
LCCTLAAGLVLTAAPAVAADQPVFSRIATFGVYQNTSADDGATAEISALSSDGKTVIYTDSPGERIGFVNVTNPASPQPGGVLDMPGEPTSVAVLGGYALVAVNTSPSFTAPSGKLVVLDVATRAVVREIDLGGQPDSVAVSADGKYAAVIIENERDEDVNDGAIPQLPGGFLTIVDISPNVADWATRKVALTGLASVAPTDPEPEYVSINSANKAVVSLQENNHLAIVDLPSGQVVKDFSAGSVSLTKVDTKDDDTISMTQSLTAAREPDAVAWISDTMFATANEGDYKGGSRGWTIFGSDGTVVYDSGNTLEHLAAKHGLYPDGRSDAKGTEPEAVTFARFGGVPYVFVGSERGNFVAVFNVGDPAAPVFVQMLPTNNGPEGILASAAHGLVIVSTEEDMPDEGIRSAVQVFKFGTGSAAFPSIVSGPDATGTPIGWGALSALSPVPGQPQKLWSITDSVYKPTRILTIDTATTPATITAQLAVTKAGAPASYDAEGLIARADGGFWLAAEGATGPANQLVRLDSNGAVVEEIPLPAEIGSKLGSNGLEGIAFTGSGSTEQVWVALQRPLTGDPANTVRIGRYSVAGGTWAWLGYGLDAAPAGATVGLSELVALDGDTFAVIERDNKRGPAAQVKKVYSFDVPAGIGTGMPSVKKTLNLDLLPLMSEGKGWVQDKIEGLAIGGDGNVYAVTDNDGIDDATGETLFLRLGTNKQVFPAVFGGSLPTTGGNLVLYLLIGVSLVLAGAAAFVLARRRRPRLA